MKLPYQLNRLLTAFYLRRKGVVWSGEIPYMDMLRPPRFIVYGEIVLGSGVRFSTHLGNHRTLIQVDKDATITIGNNVDFNNVYWMRARQGIVIEDNVRIGPEVTILDANMHPLYPSDPDTPRPVRLGRNCLIYMRSIILAGVDIGEHSVVGAGSIVTKNVPAKTEVAGNPAHFIKSFESHHYPKDWVRS